MKTDLPNLFFSFMIDTALLTGIPLAIATAVGLLISIFQAVTSIQDQTLSQSVKIVTIVAVLLTMGPYLAAPLVSDTLMLYDNLAPILGP